MPGASRVGMDSAGAVIVGVLAPTVFINNANVSVVGAAVQGHPPWGPHIAPSMAAGSPNVFANNIAVCREGDSATCGHPTSGSGDVFIN